MLANPSVTIEAAPRDAGAEESNVEKSRGRSDLDGVFVAALYAAVVVPTMAGWLYLLAVYFWKVMIWMIA